MTFRSAAVPACGLIFILATACGRTLEGPVSASTAPFEEALAAASPSTPIRHIVVLIMENRSFDHLLGWVPGADGMQAGLTFLDAAGRAHPTHALAPDYQGCGHSNPDHSYQGGRVEYDGGRNDGWLRAGSNDDFAIGYYTQKDLAFLGQAVPEWTSFDRYFPSIMSETIPNRIYQHAAQTDRLSDTYEISTLPTVWDLLAAHGLKGRYYFSDVPFLALWGPKYVGISRPIAQFYLDAVTGNLPDVSFVDGQFLQESLGTGDDDHPHCDIRDGESFMNSVYRAVTHSPQWKSTVLFINFDEWGGFFDHVPPPQAAIPPASARAGDVDGRLGFRVPALLVAPWAVRGRVSHTQYDHTSVLRMIEANWGLPALTTRDATAANPTAELDFEHPRSEVPDFAVPVAHFGQVCLSDALLAIFGQNEFVSLAALAEQHGFPIP